MSAFVGTITVYIRSMNGSRITPRVIILLVPLYRPENWSLTRREWHRVSMCGNKVLRCVNGYRSKTQNDDTENYIMINFIASNFLRIFLLYSDRRRRMAWGKNISEYT
jgi:hypothetical protein